AMPKRYSHGGRVDPGAPGGPPGARTVDGRAPRTLAQRFSALGNLRPFLALVWEIDRVLAIATLALRLVRALVPVATLYFGKLIVDEVVRLAALARMPEAPVDLAGWLASGHVRMLL